MSLSMLEIESSAASEMEIEELTQQVLWERNRAGRAEELVEFLQAECKMRICSCGKTRKTVTVSTQSEPEEPIMKRIAEEPEEQDEQDDVEDHLEPPVLRMDTEVENKTATPDPVEENSEHQAPEEPLRQPTGPSSKKGPRRSTIFCPKEGVFRTVTEQEAMILEAQKEAEIVAHREDTVEHHEIEPEQHNHHEYEPSQEHEPDPQDHLQEDDYEHELAHEQRYGQEYIQELELELEQQPPSPIDEELMRNPRMYARTPSADPPTFAMLGKQRASLMSLLNAPHNDVHSNPLPSSFSVPVVEAADYPQGSHRHSQQSDYPDNEYEQERDGESLRHASLESRPQSSATLYSVTTTTTSVPIHSEDRKSSSSFSDKLRTPSTGSNASFDTKNPALTPTMTREQALAKIRERRGRARSAAQGPPTATKKPATGGPSRNMSAPTGKPSSRLGKSRS